MNLFTNFILFVCIWWVFFFISLPINISILDHAPKGHTNSALKKTFIGHKIIITSAISIIIMLFLLKIIFDLGVIFK